MLGLMLGPLNQQTPKLNTVQLIDKKDYNASGDLIYYGMAIKGSVTSDAAWIIYKVAYDASGNDTGTTASAWGSIWDNRATSVTYS